jgi:Bacterial toxin homologue of phage lysozyme, C-term
MRFTEILEIADSVKRTSHRVKNSGDMALAELGLRIARKVKKQRTVIHAKTIEKEYLWVLREKYFPILPQDKILPTITSMAGYDDSSDNPYSPVDSTTDIETPNGNGPDNNTETNNPEPPSGTYIIVVENLSNTIDITDDPNTIDNSTHQIDYEQIGDHEGGQHLSGYVPSDKNGNPIDKSGVTIATGIDLGQMSEKEINNLSIPEDLKDKLSDYVGVNGIELLREKPLIINEQEAILLDNAIQEKMSNALISSYNLDSAELKFTDLPPEIQNAIASVSYQYGDLATSCPKFWTYITEYRWSEAENELRNFGDKFHSRRELEANLFHKGIEKIESTK